MEVDIFRSPMYCSQLVHNVAWVLLQPCGPESAMAIRLTAVTGLVCWLGTDRNILHCVVGWVTILLYAVSPPAVQPPAGVKHHLCAVQHDSGAKCVQHRCVCRWVGGCAAAGMNTMHHGGEGIPRLPPVCGCVTVGVV